MESKDVCLQTNVDQCWKLERAKEYGKQWREKHPEYSKEHSKQWREANPERAKENTKQ